MIPMRVDGVAWCWHCESHRSLRVDLLCPVCADDPKIFAVWELHMAKLDAARRERDAS